MMPKNKTAPTPELSVLLSEFNRSLMLIADRRLLIGNFIAKLKTIVPVESAYIFLLDESTGRYRLQNDEAGSTGTVLPGRGKLIGWLSINETHLLLSRHPDIVEYFSDEERAMLTALKTELIYPLKVMNQISGTVFLGPKCDGTPFSEEEIALLSLLFDQAAFAIEHASLYEIQRDRIKRMYRSDRLALLGELAAGAAHEIRNPLTAIRSTIQYLSKDFQHDPVKSEMITELITEVERINKIVQGLLSFSRPSELNRSALDVRELIVQTLTLLSPNLVRHRIEVQFDRSPDNAVIHADADQLKQVFINIVLNAVEAMSLNDGEHPRTLAIRLESGAPVDSGRRLLIVSFEDTGPGIREGDIENVFNPFFTTKEEGTGLGLAISYGIVHRHEGDIEVERRTPRGTRVTVKLPQQL